MLDRLRARSDLNGQTPIRLQGPPVEPSQGSTDRTLFGFQRPMKLRRDACCGHPRAKDESGWPRRATPGNRAAQSMRGPEDRSSPGIARFSAARCRSSPSGGSGLAESRAIDPREAPFARPVLDRSRPPGARRRRRRVGRPGSRRAARRAARLAARFAPVRGLEDLEQRRARRLRSSGQPRPRARRRAPPSAGPRARSAPAASRAAASPWNRATIAERELVLERERVARRARRARARSRSPPTCRRAADRSTRASSASGDAHHPAVHVVGGSRRSDRVAEALRHLLDAVGPAQQRMRDHGLRGLAVVALDLARHQQIEGLIGSAELDVRARARRSRRPATNGYSSSWTAIGSFAA